MIFCSHIMSPVFYVKWGWKAYFNKLKTSKIMYLFLSLPERFFLHIKVNKDLKIKKGIIDNEMGGKTICTGGTATFVLLQYGFWGWSTRVGSLGVNSHWWTSKTIQKKIQNKSWVSKSGLKLVWKMLMTVKEQPGAGLGKVVPLRRAPGSVLV